MTYELRSIYCIVSKLFKLTKIEQDQEEVIHNLFIVGYTLIILNCVSFCSKVENKNIK